MAQKNAESWTVHIDRRLVEEVRNALAWVKVHRDETYTKVRFAEDALRNELARLKKKHGRQRFPKADALPTGRPPDRHGQRSRGIYRGKDHRP